MKFNQGASVVTLDSEEAGHIVRVVVGPKLIPVGWVERLTDDEVHLVIDSDLVERLPVVEAA